MSAEHLNRSGRRAGVPNRYTGSIKEMILGALKDVGGQEYLAEQARANPVAFLGLVGKVLPLQLASDPDNPLQWVVRIPLEANSMEEWLQRYAPPHIRDAQLAKPTIEGSADTDENAP